jgi:hypothetical protein
VKEIAMFPLTTIVAVSLTLMCQTGAGQPSPQKSPQLADAIKAFNENAAKDPIGKDQPPLTEEEVIAAIRDWERPKDSPLSDEMYEVFKRIAETRTLPPTAEFEKLTGYDRGGAFILDVWSVRIRMYRPDRSSYAVIIRERMIRSRTLEEELVLAEKRLQDTPPLPGTYRLKERVEDLKARIAKMKAK